jgi:hypothetical protein
MITPWDKATGWEYDVLRLLRPFEALDVWLRARDQAFPRVYLDWRVVSSLLLIGLLGLTHIIVIWNLTAWLGLVPFGCFIVDLFTFRPFAVRILLPIFQLVFPSPMRPYVRDELFRLIQQDLPPDHPLLQLRAVFENRQSA